MFFLNCFDAHLLAQLRMDVIVCEAGVECCDAFACVALSRRAGSIAILIRDNTCSCAQRVHVRGEYAPQLNLPAASHPIMPRDKAQNIPHDESQMELKIGMNLKPQRCSSVRVVAAAS